MVQLVLTLGILNLLLGYGLAVMLANPRLGAFAPWKKWSLAWPRIRPGSAVETPLDTDVMDEPPAADLAPKDLPDEDLPQEARSAETELADLPLEPTVPAAPPLPLVATIDELPLAWREVLETEHLAPHWLAEGVVQALRIQLANYRQQVLAAESRARLVLSQENSEGVEQLVADFRFLHHEWLGRLMEGAQMLRLRHGRLGDAEEQAVRLEMLLYDRASQMEAVDRRISEINFKTDVVLGCRRLLAELLELTTAVHQLRDDLTAGLADIGRQQQTLNELPHEQRLDPLTGRLNRIGLELVAGSSGQEGSQRQAVLIAIDGFRKVNERLGTRAGDRTLRAFSQLLADLLDSARASAEIVRLDGTRFLLLLDGTSRDQATNLAEQLRQSLEGVTFDSQGTCFGLSASLGIATSELGSGLSPLLQQLEAALDAAKIAGRNRCAIADVSGAKAVAPIVVPVVSRRVAISNGSELVVQSAPVALARESEPLPVQPAPAAESTAASSTLT